MIPEPMHSAYRLYRSIRPGAWLVAFGFAVAFFLGLLTMRAVALNDPRPVICIDAEALP